MKAGSKVPDRSAWTELRVTEANICEYFNENVNIGVLLGTPSGGLVDVDLDSRESILMADAFLPMTNAVFGRPSKLASHRLYLADPTPNTERFKDPDGTTLVELRSTGCQTVIPPSSHSGETVSWSKNEAPFKLEGSVLRERVKRLAAAALFARHWATPGSRQEAALALAGGLSKLGWDPTEVGDFIVAVARAAGDEEWKMRFNAAEYTQRRLARDLPATGWARLETFLGADVVRRGRAWLKASAREPLKDEAASSDQTSSETESKTQAQQLLKLADQATLFHTPDEVGFATVPVKEHKENLQIRSSGFRGWLLFEFYKKYRKPPSTDALKNAIDVLAARSLFDAPMTPACLRIGRAGTDIYIDLCNSDWEVVHVTSSGWRILAESPVRFYRARGMTPLPRPEPGGSVDALREHINAQDEKAWKLIVGWVIGALHPTGPYPILILQGEAGTAKSTTARVLRSLVDPSTSPARSAPREDRDLMIASHNSWVLNYDNLSALQNWLSDAFCRLATGGGLSTRQLFTDLDEVIFNATRPIILNGIDDLAGREDLADRALIVMMSPISEDRRRSEADLEKRFSATAPRIFGGLLDVLCESIPKVGSAPITQLPRMADFVQRVANAETKLGWSTGSFVEAYREGHTNTAAEWLEGDSVAKILLEMLGDYDEWKGTATDLLAILNRMVDEEVRRGPKWPKDSRALGGRVRRAAPFLRKAGIETGFEREPRSRRKLITFRKGPKITVPLVLEFPLGTSEPGREEETDTGTRGDREKPPASVTEMVADDDAIGFVRTGEGRFQCVFCAQEFESRAGWRGHILQNRCPRRAGRSTS